MKIIAITGGIGSGKSVVSAVLRRLGHEVYDCDSRAKMLMRNSAAIKSDLVAAFGPNVITVDGEINSRELAAIVFANRDALVQLNAIVHPRVKADILAWSESRKSPVAFVETAILEESGLSDIVAEVWTAFAPEDVRVSRVMARNGISEAEVRSRIASQKTQGRDADGVIVNDDIEPILPQVMAKLAELECKRV